MSVIFFVSKY